MIDKGWHITQIRVRYSDTDRMGIVYYGNYFTFFEIGRTEYMREAGIPYSELERKGYFMVVIKANAAYHANVGYDSLITIKTAITDFRKVRIRFDYEVLSEKQKLLVQGHTIHACLDTNMKPVRIPDNMIAALRNNMLKLV
jgi:acyl-CoA thioester hydrolase